MCAEIYTVHIVSSDYWGRLHGASVLFRLNKSIVYVYVYRSSVPGLKNFEPPALSTSHHLDISQLEVTTEVLKTSYLLPPMLHYLGKWLWALVLQVQEIWITVICHLWEHDLSFPFQRFFSSESLSSANLLLSVKLCNVFVRWIGLTIFSWLMRSQTPSQGNTIWWRSRTQMPLRVHRLT